MNLSILYSSSFEIGRNESEFGLKAICWSCGETFVKKTKYSKAMSFEKYIMTEEKVRRRKVRYVLVKEWNKGA